MKRSRSIRLILIGTLSVGTFHGCSPDAPPEVSARNVYTNNFFVPGAGYYHAPFRAWYPLRYNHFDPQNRLYYFGGQLSPSPHQSITNISSPIADLAMQAQVHRTDVPRGGFGRTSGSHWIHS